MRKLLATQLATLIAVALGALGLGLAGLAQARTVLAYESGAANGPPHVWLAGVSGKHPHRLGPGSQPMLSPNGSSVAASLFGPTGPALVIYRTGAASVHYFDVGKVSVSAEAWSPDSRYLAVQLASVKSVKRGWVLAIIDTRKNTVKRIATGSVCGASFAPRTPDRLVYGRAPGSLACFNGPDNIYTVGAGGSGRKQLTHDGASLNPVWGAHSIAFDRATLRKNEAPSYQLWLMRSGGGHRSQVTHLHVPPLLEGLVPVAFSATGERLLADYEGEDTSQTWTVQLPSGHVHQLTVAGQSITPGGISRNGRSILVDFGGFENPPSKGKVETLPFGGGHPKVLVKHGSAPSWNK